MENLSQIAARHVISNEYSGVKAVALDVQKLFEVLAYFEVEGFDEMGRPLDGSAKITDSEGVIFCGLASYPFEVPKEEVLDEEERAWMVTAAVLFEGKIRLHLVDVGLSKDGSANCYTEMNELVITKIFDKNVSVNIAASFSKEEFLLDLDS